MDNSTNNPLESPITSPGPFRRRLFRVPDGAPPEQWLMSTTPMLPKHPRTRDAMILQEQLFTQTFYPAMDEMAGGAKLKDIIKNSPHGIRYGEFVRWIMKDDERRAIYETAQEVLAEYLVDELRAAADGDDPLEDLDRSSLRMRAAQYLIEKLNRKKYAPGKDTSGNLGVIVNVCRDGVVPDGPTVAVIER